MPSPGPADSVGMGAEPLVHLLGSTIPGAVSAGQASGDGWSTAVSTLTAYDLNGVFSNPFPGTLLG